MLHCRALPGSEVISQSIIVAPGAAALLSAGGRTILGRLAEMLRRAGCPPIAVVCADELVDGVGADVEGWTADCQILPASDSAGLAALVEDAPELVVVADATVVYDGRLIEQVVGATAATALVDSAPPAPRDRGLIDGCTFAGLAALDREQLGKALVAGVPALELTALAATPGVEPRDIDEMPRYSNSLRRSLRPFWIPIARKSDVRSARKALADAAGKGTMEWYVLLVNRPVERFLSYYLSEWRITPNQITFVGNIVAFSATALFFFGRLWPALALVFATAILDGLDGRQARIQIKTSRVGEIEHVFDAIAEVSWMVALAWFLSSNGAEPLYLYAAGAWTLFYAADNYAYTFYRVRRGIMIDQATLLDEAIRFVGSRRNTNFVTFAVAVALGYPAEGFLVVVGYNGLTALAHWIRVATLLSRPATGSWRSASPG